MQRPLCKFCGTRDHHQSEMHLCKAMKSDVQPHIDDARKAVAEKREVRKKIDAVKVSEDPGPDGGVQAVSDEVSFSDGVAPGSKVDRLEVARTVLTNAERCARYRVKHREKVLRADRLRKAAKRSQS